MTTEVKKRQVKCKYYNKGYCKKKNECLFYHPTNYCIDKCKNSECKFRHRIKCRYVQYCYHYIKNQCEYIHESTEVLDVPMTTDENEKE